MSESRKNSQSPPKEKRKSQSPPKKRRKKKQVKEEKEEKQYLKPGHEIVKRMLYDPQYDAEQVHVVYLDRFVGLEEIELEEFNESDIPSHRIYKFLINGHVVWDREKRKDLISDGTAVQFIRRDGEDERKDENEKEREKGEDKKNDESRRIYPIIFNMKKNRDIYKQYVPQDKIEEFCLHQNRSKICLISPTHISQRGGYYHIAPEDIIGFYQQWEESITIRDVFYMEEFRTPVFRLYLDFDLKTTNGKRFTQMLSWIPRIQYIVNQFFNTRKQRQHDLLNESLNSNVLVCESHGEWKDSVTTEANYKSGYRFYFTCIYVDMETMIEFTTLLCSILKQQSSKKEEEEEKDLPYPFCPSDWRFEDICDLEQCHHEKARMFGSRKFRRGKDLGRMYKFFGYFNQKGERLRKFENLMTTRQLIHLSTVRYMGEKEMLNQFDRINYNKTNVLIFKKGNIVEKGKAIIPRLEPRKEKENEK